MAEIVVEPIEKYGLNTQKQVKTLFSRIGVVGCGKEGQSIARIAAWHGLEVVFVELSHDKIDSAIDNIGRELDNRIENWGLTQSEKRAIMGRIRGSLDYKDLDGCDFVIEAIRSDDNTGIRSLDSRKQVFRDVEAIVGRDTIIATNATTIVISELAAELQYPDRCVSLHFFVTSAEARIVEVVRGLYTTDDVYNKVSTFVKLINREAIHVEESAGLISVRLYVVLLNEACEALMEGVAKLEDIDKTMVVGLGMRFGPFRHADLIGLNKVVRWMDNLYEEFGDPKYKPSPLLKRLVRAKHFGIQSGVGFYRYDEKNNVISE
jgi:3-hydroxybutyryl-CoA dehydrogenase